MKREAAEEDIFFDMGSLSVLGGKAGAREKSSSHSNPPPAGVYNQSGHVTTEKMFSTFDRLQTLPSSSVELSELANRFR